MSAIDGWLEGLMHGPSGIGVILLIGLLLGLRHASDPDHLAAVTTLIASEEERKQARKAGLMGLLWGLGHGTTLVVLGLPLVLFNRFLPEPVRIVAETLIGAIIVFLAVRLLVRWRRGLYHAHTHIHDDEPPHRHVHSHREDASHEHAHALPHRDARRDRDAEFHSVAESDAFAHGHAHGDADTFAHGDAQPDADRDSDADALRDADAESDAFRRRQRSMRFDRQPHGREHPQKRAERRSGLRLRLECDDRHARDGHRQQLE